MTDLFKRIKHFQNGEISSSTSVNASGDFELLYLIVDDDGVLYDTTTPGLSGYADFYTNNNRNSPADFSKVLQFPSGEKGHAKLVIDNADADIKVNEDKYVFVRLDNSGVIQITSQPSQIRPR